MKNLKVAIVHDYLIQMGGAEKVLEVLVEMFPKAPVYTIAYDPKKVKEFFPDVHIESSIIQRLPGGLRHYRWYLPLMPMAVEFFDLSDYDLVISSASGFVKGVVTKPETLHICYCHTPTRYLWSDTHQYISELPYNKYFKKIISLFLNYTRMWDRLAADRVDFFIANSRICAQRIKKYYKRESIVINPSINVKDFHISPQTKDYYLAGCRLVSYKRVDILIEAFKELGLKLKIFGSGRDRERLEKMAAGHHNIEFLGRINDQEKSRLYSECVAFLNPQEEDFGITPLEAMASGRPVIGLDSGGSLESIIPGKTGIFIKEQSKEEIISAVNAISKINFNPKEIRAHAEQFSHENFKKHIAEAIKNAYKNFVR